MKAALFPGQGVDAAAILAALPEDHVRLREACKLVGYDLRRAVERSDKIVSTRDAQPAILTAGVISFERALETDLDFVYLVGHSLGEYTALVCGGAISFPQGVRLVAARAEAMSRAANRSSGGMVAVLRFDPQRAVAIAEANDVAVANDNSPTQIVLSGDEEPLARVARTVTAEGGRVVRLPVEGAFHSAAMELATAALEEALVHVSVRTPNVPVISNVSARPYRAPGEIRKLLLAQLTGRVRFRESVEWLSRTGVTEFVDLGPGRIVDGLVRSTLRSRKEPAHA